MCTVHYKCLNTCNYMLDFSILKFALSKFSFVSDLLTKIWDMYGSPFSVPVLILDDACQELSLKLEQFKFINACD